MESERARPLAALVLVAMLCAFIVTVGMQRNRADGLRASAPPAAAAPVAETRFVLGSTLTPKPSKSAQRDRSSLLTAVATLASSSGSASSVSSVTDHGRAHGHRPAHRHPVDLSHPAGQGQGTTPSDGPTSSTSPSTGIAARLVPQDEPTSEVPSSPRSGGTALDFADAVQAWQDAIGEMIQTYGDDAEQPAYVPGQLEGDGGDGR